jgi:SOS response associated peptidase (SRAP)
MSFPNYLAVLCGSEKSFNLLDPINREKSYDTAKPKLPFAIAMKDGRPFTFAGLWENWQDPGSGEWLRTCTIITGEPNELVAQIHPRFVSSPPTTSQL